VSDEIDRLTALPRGVMSVCVGARRCPRPFRLRKGGGAPRRRRPKRPRRRAGRRAQARSCETQERTVAHGSEDTSDRFRLGSPTWKGGPPPLGFRTKNYAALLHEAREDPALIRISLPPPASRGWIRRSANRCRITIFTARPGIISAARAPGSKAQERAAGAHGQGGLPQHRGGHSPGARRPARVRNVALQLQNAWRFVAR